MLRFKISILLIVVIPSDISPQFRKYYCFGLRVAKSLFRFDLVIRYEIVYIMVIRKDLFGVNFASMRAFRGH